MRIILCASDLVKRGLWDTYSYYVVGSEKEAERLLLEDKEFEISERDAFVCGLLKVIETDNLIHRFNDTMVHFLNIKSVKIGDDILIKKKSCRESIDKFINKFPDYWTPPTNYANALSDLVDYTNVLKDKLETLDVVKATLLNVNYEFYVSSSVKKLLNFNYY
jgi:hypothetical protein